MKTLTLVLALVLAQAQQPVDLARQMETLSKQLIAALTGPTPTQITSGAALKTALLSGGVITLASGTYVGNFVISKPTTLSGPADAFLEPADPLGTTLTVAADDVLVSGLTIKNGAIDRTAVEVGDAAAITAAAQPHRVTFTGTTVLAGSLGGHRGFALHGSDIALKNVQVRNFWENGRDSQAVWINNGPGPYTVENSFLEASGENVLLGGSDPAIPGVVPSDVTIRGNTIYKPQSFVTQGTVKNSFEVKNGQRVLFENNTIDGNWKDGQDGTPILLTTRNQDGTCTWCIVDDVTIRGNIVKNTPQGFALSILGLDDTNPSKQTQTVMIEGNLFQQSPRGLKIGNGVTKLLTVRRNTFPAITDTFITFWTATSSGTPTITPLVFAQNVLKVGQYSVAGDGTTVGPTSLGLYALVQDFSGNVMEQSAVRAFTWPAGNTMVPAGKLLSLLDPVTFKLLSGSAGW